MATHLKYVMGARVAELLSQADSAWKDWQELVQQAAVDPVRARAFWKDAAQQWRKVEDVAAALGLALLAAEGQATESADKARPIPIEPATLQLLEDRLNGHRAVSVLNQSESALARLRKVVGKTPQRALDRALFLGQVETLRSKVRWDVLETLTNDERQLALIWLAARVRWLQAFSGEQPPKAKTACSTLMRLLARALGLGVTGHVHGLAHRHEPRGTSWLEDALAVEAEIDRRVGRLPRANRIRERSKSGRVDDGFRRLRELSDNAPAPVMLAVVDELLTLGVADTDVRWRGPLKLRAAEVTGTAARDRVRRGVMGASSNSGRTKAQASSWEKAEMTRGKHAVILGGDRRGDRIKKLQAHFEFAVLDWRDLPTGSPRAVKSVVEQLKAGKYDVAIVLQQFISHAVTDKVFGVKADGLTVALAHGYGVRQMEQGLERFLGRADV